MQECFEKQYLVAEIAYDGSAFCGSQIQPDRLSVNGLLQRVFNSFGLYGKVLAAGRTDKGVHALRNVVAIELPYRPKDFKWFQSQINQKLLPHIQVRSLRICPMDFHPRFSAKARHYRYVISQKPLNVFQSRYFYYDPMQGVEKISQAIHLFEGWHDFSYFSKVTPKFDKVRQIHFAKMYTHQDFFIFSFKGNGFLHSQVRLMVSALLELGRGNITIDQLQEQLEVKKRYITQAAPPQGLYLCKVYY